VAGDVAVDTGSGNVNAADLRGSFKCDTGSGECIVKGFSGERLVCDTGSGKVRVSSASAHSIAIDSGSGNVVLEEADAEELSVDTGSGDLEVTSPSRRLARLKADTGSGNVKLRLAADAGFEAHADLGSGDIVNRYADAQPILKKREVVGYRRGDGRIRIDVDTGSGNLILEPGK
jgi:lia operon protein LiaG